MSTREFNQLLLQNSEYLKPFAVTLTKDQESAKDLLQETMFRALSNQEKYSVGTNIKAWLYTMKLLICSMSLWEQSKVEFTLPEGY